MGQMRLFASNIKELQPERIAFWSSLVLVDRWGWDSAETLLAAPHNSAPWGGLGGGAETGEHFAQIIFSIFFHF